MTENFTPQNEFCFSTGRKVYAYGQILGIGPDGSVYGGFDDEIERDVSSNPGYEYESPLTPQERMELAEVAIKRWKEFASKEP